MLRQLLPIAANHWPRRPHVPRARRLRPRRRRRGRRGGGAGRERGLSRLSRDPGPRRTRRAPGHPRWRAGLGQGAGRDAAALPLSALAGALRGLELRGSGAVAARIRALRPRGRGLHRRGFAPPRAVRGRGPGHALPGRNRGHARGGAGENPPRRGVWGVRTGGRLQAGAGGRAHRGRVQRGPARAGSGRAVQARPAGPPQLRGADAAAAAGAGRGHSAAGAALRGADGGRAGPCRAAGLQRGGRGPAVVPPLAGQRARTEERGRAGGEPRRGRRSGGGDLRPLRLALPPWRRTATGCGYCRGRPEKRR